MHLAPAVPAVCDPRIPDRSATIGVIGLAAAILGLVLPLILHYYLGEGYPFWDASNPYMWLLLILSPIGVILGVFGGTRSWTKQQLCRRIMAQIPVLP